MNYTVFPGITLVKEIDRVQIDLLCVRKLLKTDIDLPSCHKFTERLSVGVLVAFCLLKTYILINPRKFPSL